MNREIKFRGKGIEEYDKDKWYYGSYFIYNEINYFCLDDGSRTKEINEKIKNNIKHKIIFEVQGDLNMENHIKLADVNPETVGQYTGLDDKNGKEIYEGDIVLLACYHYKEPVFDGEFEVIYDEINGTWLLVDLEDKENVYTFENIRGYYLTELEKIGNIYDNPEVLGGE